MLHDAGGNLTVLLRFVALAATTGVLGAWVFGRFVAGRLPGEAGERYGQALLDFSARAAIWCAGILLLSTAPRLVAQASPAVEAGGGTWPAAVALLGTSWGWALALQALAAAGVAARLMMGPRTRAWPPVATIGVGVLAVVPAFLGHAGAAQELRAASVLVDIVHVAAAGAWVGTLGLLAATAIRERHAAHAPTLTAALIIAFHPVAMVAAGTVFVTGLATAWLRMGAPAGIASSSYSGLFVAKLLLVLVTGALGAGHSKLARRRIKSVEVQAVGRTLLAEALLALLVLLVTAVLAGTAPIL